MERPSGGTGVSAEIISAPSNAVAADPNAVLKPVVPAPTDAGAPGVEKPAEAPTQVNDIKSTGATATPINDGKKKKPKVDSDESSSKKKKKKGLDKLNPF
jgi:outer membrane protein assembly factor BamD